MSKERVIEWAEFQAEGKARKWMVIHDKVYDVSAFIDRHPGGFLIWEGVGFDATTLFEMHHINTHVAESLLPKYCIGRIGKYTPDENPAGFYTWDSPFYSTLKQRVRDHFAAKGTSWHDHPLGLFKALFMPIVWLYAWYQCLYLGNAWAIPLFGLAATHCGMQTMHDSCHGGLSASPLVNRLVGYVGDMIGSASYIWKQDHVVGHHAFTNHDQDPNATTGVPVIRFHPKIPHWSHHRFQHYYIWLVYAAVTFQWPVVDMISVFQGKYHDTPLYVTTKLEVVVFWVLKAVWASMMWFTPFYFHGWHGFLCYAGACTLASYHFALQFAVTHISDDAEFVQETGKDGIERDWATLQVQTSTNYSSDSWLASFYSAGLNLQTEHHLFPTIANPYYWDISPIVRKTCEEFGLKYNNHPSYLDALSKHYQHLKKLSVP